MFTDKEKTMLFRQPMYFVYLIIAILLSLSFHELAHAFISYRLGDPTARDHGRLTLNPLKHLDPIGTIMIIASMISGGRGFGWARPVPINPMYYKDKKKGTILTSLAGPLSNILLALLFAFPFYYIGTSFGAQSINEFSLKAILFNFGYMFYSINIGLAVFNIIPVPPLDGSKILSGVLPSRYYFRLMQYENYIGIIFLILIFAFPRVLSTILSPLYYVVETAIMFIVKGVLGVLL